MTKSLVIVFVKNIKLGSVKTRLAKTIGDYGAFEVYSELVKITQKATENLAADTRIYYSNEVVDDQWKTEHKTAQNGIDLGERMLNAFKQGFEDGYENIVLIGSDLPDIKQTHIEGGLKLLNDNDVVFGPAEDGGYYLIGLSKLISEIFENKPWSRPHLLQSTLEELKTNHAKVDFLESLNDIDTYDDLIASEFYKNNEKLQEKIQQLYD